MRAMSPQRDVWRALGADVDIPRGTSGESLAFLFAATGARRVRRPDHVVVAIGFTATGGGLLLRRRCRRPTRCVVRGGDL